MQAAVTDSYEIQVIIAQAQRTKLVHLSYRHLSTIPLAVFDVSKLIRLDLELPVQLSECEELQVLDISETDVIGIPRELAELKKLVDLNMNGCRNLKQSVAKFYQEGISSIHQYLRRKADRRSYKQQLVQKLKENQYPDEKIEKIQKLSNDIMNLLKDADNELLKKLIHNFNRLFPDKFRDANPQKVKQGLEKIHQDTLERNELNEFQVQIRSMYPNENMVEVALLAKDIFENTDAQERKEIVASKQNIFNKDFDQTNLESIKQTLNSVKQNKNNEREQAIQRLKAKLHTVYGGQISDLDEISYKIAALFKSVKHLDNFATQIKLGLREFLPEKAQDINPMELKKAYQKLKS